MSLLIAIIVGVAVGAAGGFWLRENIDYLLVNVFFGIAGSIFGLVLYVFLPRSEATTPLFDPAAILTSIVGALVFVLVFNALHKFTVKHTPNASHLQNRDVEPDNTDE